ncbi:MAG: hypothetical protein LBB12_02230 [Holosporaceae bacterium]|nr:hypothetical protein [Holosporaceae bacterium]
MNVNISHALIDGIQKKISSQLNARSERAVTIAQEQALAYHKDIIQIEENTTVAIRNLISLVQQKMPALFAAAVNNIYTAAYGKDGSFMVKIRPLLEKELAQVKKDIAQSCILQLSQKFPTKPFQTAAHMLFLASVKSVADTQKLNCSISENITKASNELQSIDAINENAMQHLDAFHLSSYPYAQTLFAKTIYEDIFLQQYGQHKGYGVVYGSIKILFEGVLDKFLAAHSSEEGALTLFYLNAAIDSIALQKHNDEYKKVDFQLCRLYLMGKKKDAPNSIDFLSSINPAIMSIVGDNPAITADDDVQK